MIKYGNRYYTLKRKSGSIFETDRLMLIEGCNKITLYVGADTEEFTVSLKLAVVEDDLFSDF